MVQDPPRRTGISGPTLVRLLARLTDARFSEPALAAPAWLSQRLGWADAIALSATLKGNPPSVPAGVPASGEAGEREYARVRAALENAIAGDDLAPAARQRSRIRPKAPRDPNAPPPVVEYDSYRRRYIGLQQSMESSIGALRGCLRTMLVARSPEAARLAAVDAAMEQALAEQELSLLMRVPSLLEGHFERLRKAGETGEPAALQEPAAWLPVFRKDMQRVLLAELDFRLQPVQGLLAALRGG